MTKKHLFLNGDLEDPYIKIGILEAMVEHFYEISDDFTADPSEIYGDLFWRDVQKYVNTYIKK